MKQCATSAGARMANALKEGRSKISRADGPPCESCCPFQTAQASACCAMFDFPLSVHNSDADLAEEFERGDCAIAAGLHKMDARDD